MMTSTGTTPDISSASDSDPDAVSTASDVSNKSKSDHSDDSSDRGSDSDKDDSEEEEEEEEEEEDDVNDDSHIIWSGPGKKVPIISFRADALFTKVKGLYHVGDKYHLAYKMVKTECRLIRQVLAKHGFHEAHPNSSDFNLMWTGSHVKPFTLRSLTEFQKVNHFPRSYELTRKDRLYKNIQRMQHSKGMKHFDFIPQSFVTPSEYEDFHGAHMKEKSTWIVKPIASSRGRGIFLINHPQQLPLDETLLVARYIGNPLCIDGFKFDIRLYVGVTSYDPVRIYIFEEGLTRFATVQYEKSAKSIRNTCMHLTNYSVNKKSSDYVRCDDPNIEDYGNKWSLGAMLRYIKKQGRDVTGLMSRIEDLVIKTILAGELPIATACKMFMPNRGNCFELYGFDILVDDNLRTWLLEVNLSPSLACDAPLDSKIKANMIADLFTLTGFTAHDPMMRKTQQSRRNQELAASSALRQQRQRPQSAGSINLKNFSSNSSRPSSSSGPRSKDDNRLTGEEVRIVRETKEENARRGGWVRVFPSPESWDKYSSFLESRTTNNEMVHKRLFPDRKLSVVQEQMADLRKEHMVQYLRKLTTVDNRIERRKLLINAGRNRTKPPTGRPPTSKPPITREKATERKDSLTKNRREPLAQGELKEEKARKASTSSTQQTETKTSSTATATATAKTTNTTKQDSDSKTESDSKAKENMPPTKPKADNTETGSTDTRQVLPEKPPPPPPPPKPKVNVAEIIENGGELSKLQAREAFAAYLNRVQNRFSEDIHSGRIEGQSDMLPQDLVLRFLKRAAGNLQQPFKVIVPSRKLPINDRRRILAKQLGDFVHIYGKETEQLQQRRKLERKYLNKDVDQIDGYDEEKFKNFIIIASESELEEVLTVYTKLNKSASIFLGTNSKAPPGDMKTHPSNASQGQNQSLLQRRSSTSEINKLGLADKEKGFNHKSLSRPSSAVTVYRDNTGGEIAARHFSEGSEQAIQEALQRLARRQAARQYSASSAQNQNLVTSQYLGQYSGSTSSLADSSACPGSLSASRSTSSMGQRSRTHSWEGMKSHSTTSVTGTYPTTAQNYATRQVTSHEQITQTQSQLHDLAKMSQERMKQQQPTTQQYEVRGTSISERGSASVAHGTSDSQGPEGRAELAPSDLAKAYNTVIGVAPQNNYQPTPGSYQLQYALQQQLQAQQHSRPSTSQQQSRPGTADKPKEIAQAHSHMSQQFAPQQLLVPKPPVYTSSAARKPVSVQRMARTTQLDNGYANDTDYYSSLRYNTSSSAGKIRTLSSTGYSSSGSTTSKQ
ncbi:tubulin polyglutamylase TTLL5-like isoform X2 [Glandiceps talaboti]